MSMMCEQSKIYVAGHRGMVGSALLRALQQQGYSNLVTRTHSELPLENSDLVEQFFKQERPEFVFLAAAKVGGIWANMNFGADFIRENLKIQVNVIDAARRNGCKKLVFLGSSCIYPKFASQPIRETSLLTGELEPTNLPYAIAKIAGKVMCDAYRQQYNFDAFTVMPSNVYGINDNFDPQNSHVVAGIMRRIHQAHVESIPYVEIWGSGLPLRELIYADDLATACILLMRVHDRGGMVNAGSGQEISIKDLTLKIATVVGYSGEIVWDTSKPDGTPRKIMDNTVLEGYGWKPVTHIETGLRQMYAWYKSSVG